MQTEKESRRDEVMEHLFTDLQVEEFNHRYYQARGKTVKRLITLANVVAALSASAVLVGLLKQYGGEPILLLLTGVAAISSAIGPVLGLEVKYSRLEQAALCHAIAKDRIWSLLRDLKLSDLDDTHEAREREIAAFRDSLTALDEAPHDSVRRSCWAAVEREIPADKAWTII